MPEEVVTQPGDESQEPEAQATPAGEDVTTLKKRLAGKDQALTRTIEERDRVAKEAEELRRWKAEKEQADMSEFDRVTRERDEAKAEAVKAREEARMASLSAKYPQALAFLDGDPLPSEAKLAALEEKLTAKAAPADDDEPRIDPNRARRAEPVVQAKSAADHLKALEGFPDPWTRD